MISFALRRAEREWHYRWGTTFGQPATSHAEAPHTISTPPPLPPPGRGPQLVEPTMSSLRWDAAVARGAVPIRAPSVVSSSKSAAASLPSLRAVSISSSADRRRELLIERHEELQAQLALVEEMLQQNKPTTMLTSLSGFSAATSARSTAVSAAEVAAVAPAARHGSAGRN